MRYDYYVERKRNGKTISVLASMECYNYTIKYEFAGKSVSETFAGLMMFNMEDFCSKMLDHEPVDVFDNPYNVMVAARDGIMAKVI